jgi:hypothetical protein
MVSAPFRIRMMVGAGSLVKSVVMVVVQQNTCMCKISKLHDHTACTKQGIIRLYNI